MIVRVKKVRITYGSHDFHTEVAGLSVAEVKLAYQDILSVPADIQVFVNGVTSKDSTILRPGDRCEFMRWWGRKGQDFYSKREIVNFTGISEWRWDRLIKKGMEVVLIDGVEVVAEAEFRKYFQRMIVKDDSVKCAATRGRPNTTADIAEFANSRRPATTWKEIFAEWRQAHPDDDRVEDSEHLRCIWSRHYRRKPYQKAGEIF